MKDQEIHRIKTDLKRTIHDFFSKDENKCQLQEIGAILVSASYEYIYAYLLAWTGNKDESFDTVSSIFADAALMSKDEIIIK